MATNGNTYTPTTGPLRGTRGIFPPATLLLEVVAFSARTLVACARAEALRILKAAFWLVARSATLLLATPTGGRYPLCVVYRYIS